MYRLPTVFSAAEASARGASAKPGLVVCGARVTELSRLNRPRRPRPPLGGAPRARGDSAGITPDHDVGLEI